ncbi:ABC-F family ATP-binding cassette domain-containing protein [Peptostreptococcus russellii]|uniref:ABC-F family ATP-binding cassette domain-containing protein n=1 Tax=Peptostreptococcus russellii TaxID=215200 RepID=UPI00162915C4|nr:ABC-F family ATP-binding cassette domain-containing protein [Peptostreptococcus russellii]MBC2578527.1 ABC-F family ATP-binding cassette domain-containing protein [Peptostreptococcus russellii]
MLVVENVSHGFGARTILEDVSFRIRKGEHIALVGPNGEGKSSFLNIITMKLMPDAGSIKWSNRVSVGYLDQHTVLEKGNTIMDILRGAFNHMFELEKEMLEIYDKMADATDDEMAKYMEDTAEIQTVLEHSGFYTIDAKIHELANGLGLGEIGLDKDVSDLSGGQRSKVLLTKLLLENPTILVLDEPTNYLDEDHINWLRRYLQDFENAFVLVSHDIPFINDTCNVVYHLENGELNRYKGNYDEFERLNEIKKRQEETAYEKQQEERKKLEDFIARNKARVATRGMANSRQKILDKMEVLERPREKMKAEFEFKMSRASGKLIFETKDLVLGYDEALTKPLNFRLERGKKIALKGMNGIGKSTLLKTLLGIVKPFDGEVNIGDYLEVGYFEQESSHENTNTALEDVWNEFPGLDNIDIRRALAKCGLTNDHITSQVRVLSGGEAAKVRLCKIMLKEINFLVLDEPTNHLDVDAKEELKKAVKEFKGTVLLVSHEPEFYMDIVDDVWNIEDFTTKIV